MRKTIFVFALISIFMCSTQQELMSQTTFVNLNIADKFEKIIKGNFSLDKLISARRGGGSFGRSRGISRPRSTTRSTARTATRPLNPQRTPSFGGKRMSSQQAQAKYGVPRKVQPMSGTNAAGSPVNYNVHHYGGFSSSLMTGYMMGNMAWWMMAPSMLYSRPVYVEKGDGSIDVYPPSFDWGKLFTILIIAAVIIYFVRAYRRNKNRVVSNYSQSSFS